MKATIIFTFAVFIAVCSLAQKQQGDPALTEIWSPVPKVITPGKPAFTGAPSDAVVLFGSAADSMNWIGKDGKPFSWKAKDTVLTVVPFAGDLQTKKVFGDCQLHIEWRTPTEISGEGQGRGNSGISGLVLKM